MSAALVRVPFEGSTLDAVRRDGTIWVSIRRACEALGIDFSTQLQKLGSRSWATVGQCPMVAEDGKTRDIACLDLDAFPLWLATIDENRVDPEVTPKLIAYQLKAAKVLRDHFYGPRQAETFPSARAAVPALLQRAVVEGDWRTARGLIDTLAATEQLDLFGAPPRPAPRAPSKPAKARATPRRRSYFPRTPGRLTPDQLEAARRERILDAIATHPGVHSYDQVIPLARVRRSAGARLLHAMLTTGEVLRANDGGFKVAKGGAS